MQWSILMLGMKAVIQAILSFLQGSDKGIGKLNPEARSRD